MADDVSILQEIDEALRADKLEQFWKDNSKNVIAFCVLLVLSAAVSAVWKNHVRGAHEDQTFRLEQAATLADANRYNDAIALLEPLEKEGGPLAGLAALRHAEALLGMKQEDKATQVYSDLAAGKVSGAPEVLREFAAMEADILSHNQAAASGKPVGAEGSKTTGDGGPFASVRAAVDALRSHDAKNAEGLLNGIIADKDAPFSERMRAAQLLEMLHGAAK